MRNLKKLVERLWGGNQPQNPKATTRTKTALDDQRETFGTPYGERSHNVGATGITAREDVAGNGLLAPDRELPMIGMPAPRVDLPTDAGYVDPFANAGGGRPPLSQQINHRHPGRPQLYPPAEPGGWASYEPPSEPPIIGTASGLPYARVFAEQLIEYMSRTGCPPRWRRDHLIDYAGRIFAPAAGLEIPIERNLLTALKNLPRVEFQPDTHVYENGVRVGKRTIYTLPI